MIPAFQPPADERAPTFAEVDMFPLATETIGLAVRMLTVQEGTSARTAAQPKASHDNPHKDHDMQVNLKGVFKARRTYEAHFRTVRSANEEATGQRITRDDAITPWLVMHVAWLITKCRVTAAERTPHRELIGETADGKQAAARDIEADARWELRAWLGKAERNGEALARS